MASHLQLSPGNHVWLQDPKGFTVGGQVTATTGDKLTVKMFNGETQAVPAASARLMHPTSVSGVDDMITLGDLHEGALFYNLAIRFYKDQIYTYTGNILVAVNPFKSLNIYDMENVKRYKSAAFGDLSPHIFAIANETYMALNKMHMNQCVVISGESGAGKTESTKLILHFLAQASHTKSLVQDQIIEASPILEAFGNAKTVRNDNSSRFGKFIEVQFDADGSIRGALILQYLLEKSRVVTQMKDERNYHIFYSLLAGSSPDERSKYVLLSPEKYYYLSRSGCTNVATINDAQDFSTVKDAMTTLKFEGNQVQVFTTLSAILHIGNIAFGAEGDNAKVANADVVKVVAKLLGVDDNELAIALVNKKTVTRGETFVSPLNVSQSTDSRDAMAKALYGRMFSWIVSFINEQTRNKANLPFVGVLDIFGFEDFETNSFEQFCINYANERLQLYFNHHIFKLEQEEYEKEKVSWSKIEFVDNQACIDLIGKKPLGLIHILDEESNFPKSTDQSFLAKLYSNHEKCAYFVKPKQQKPVFGVRHYAGEVTYSADNFLEKNRDTLRQDLQDILAASKRPFVQQLFTSVDEQAAMAATSAAVAGLELNPLQAGDDASRSLRSNTVSSSSSSQGSFKGGGAPRKAPTVGAQFHASLNDLIATLGACNPFFVRCVKPNLQKKSGIIDLEMVTSQLRYSGMLETIRVRKAGFAVRTRFVDFLQRYHIIMPSARDAPGAASCAALLKSVKSLKSGDYVVGLTKVFLKNHVENDLEKERADRLIKYVLRLQALAKMICARKRLRAARAAARICQQFIRAFLIRRRYLRMLYLTRKVQARWRGQRARKVWGPKIKALAQARIAKEQAELARKRAAEAKMAELVASKQTQEQIKAQLENDDVFKGLGAEEFERQKNRIAAPVAAPAAKKADSSVLSDAELQAPPVNVDIPQDLAAALAELPPAYAPPPYTPHTFVPIEAVQGIFKEQRALQKSAMGAAAAGAAANGGAMAPEGLGSAAGANSGSTDSIATIAPRLASAGGAAGSDEERAAEAGLLLDKIARIFCRDGQDLKASTLAIKQSLLNLPAEASSAACDMYRGVLRYVYEMTSVEHSITIINFVASKVIQYPQLVDELYCQVCKHTNKSMSAFAHQRAWKLLAHISGLFAPTEAFFLQMYQYVAAGAVAVLSVPIQRRMRRTKVNGNRDVGYTSVEFLAMETDKPIVLKAQFVDGNAISFEADSATTGGEAIAAMTKCVQLQSAEGYVIFAELDGVEARIVSYEHLFDTLSRFERQLTKRVDGAAAAAGPPRVAQAPSAPANKAPPPPPPGKPAAPPPPMAKPLGSAPPPPPPMSKPDMNAPRPRMAPPPPLAGGKAMPSPSAVAEAASPIPWKLSIKRGYIYPCQNIDAYDFEITFQQIAMDMRRKQVCPAEQLPIVQRLIGELAKLEVIQAALEWPMYLCQFFAARERNFPFHRTEIAVDQRGVHIVDASNGQKEVALTCRYDDLIIRNATATELHVVIDDKDYTFATRGVDVKTAILGYTVPLKFLSNACIAIADFPGYIPDHLPLARGQLIQILDRDQENGWTQGQSGDRIGWFPMDFVEVLLDPVTYDARGQPIMHPAALAASVELEKRLRENKVDMVKFSAMSSDKYSMVEYAKANFDERNYLDGHREGKFTGTLKRTLGASLSSTLRRKQNVDELLKATVTDEMVTKALSWQAHAPKHPLTRLSDAADCKLMVENFTSLMAFMGDIATKSHRADLAIHMVNLGMSKEAVRDELYVQVIKQVTNNRSPKNDSVKKGWDMLAILCTFVAPSATFEPYLRNFIHNAAASTHKDIGVAAHESDVRLTKAKMQPRNLPPMEMEIEAIEQRRMMPLKVAFPEDTVKSFLFHSHTTAREILRKIFEKYDLPESNEYGLYVVLSNGYMALPVLPNDKITDIIYLSKMIVESELAAAPGALPVGPSGEYFNIEFVRKLWLEQPLNVSPALQNLIYHQILKDFLRSSLFSAAELLPPALPVIAELIACAYRVFKGPDQPPAVGMLNDAGEPLLRPWIPDIVFEKQTQAAWDGQIAASYQKFRAQSEMDARAYFLETLKGWELFGSSFFAIRASNDPRFAQGGLLCVDGVGIRVLDWNTRSLAISYGYDEIVNFRYDDNEFVMRTGDLMQKRIVRCQTNQGFVIADLIHSYVQYHMNQQMAKSPSQNDVNRIT